MQCGECATENPLEAAFCFKCGRKLSVNETALAVAHGHASSLPGLTAFEAPTREMIRINDDTPAQEEHDGRAALRIRCLACKARFYANGTLLHSIKACPVCEATPFQYENVI